MTYRPRLRLLPAVMIAASALLGVKLMDLWFTGDAFVISARAQAASSETSSSPALKLPAAKTVAPTASAKAAAAPEASKVAEDPAQMSASEIELLQRLSNRRSELDNRSAQLDQREVLMQAAEKRVDEKIAQLKSIEASIDTSAQKQDQADAARIKTVAHIYETMKAQDAARIFEQLDLSVQVNVLQQMREMKIGPILAAMDPEKAKAVTVALAERRSTRAEGGGAGQSPHAE